MSHLGHLSPTEIEPDRLRLLMTFAAVAEKLSFVEAAARFNAAPSSISRQITRLEASLGVALFTRTTRRVSLTEPGQYYYDECLALFEKIAEMDSMISTFVTEPRGTLRISAPVTFGRLYMARALNEFQALYEKVTIDAVFDDRFVDLVAGGFDLVIRTGTLPDSSLMARRIAANRRIVVASPRYVAHHGVPRVPHDLQQHNCLRYSHYAGGGGLWSFESGPEKVTVEVGGRYISNNSDIVREAALDGRGIALLAAYMATADVREGRLVQLLPNWASAPDTGIYVVYPATKQMLPKVRAFIKFLETRFSRQEWNLDRRDGTG